MTRWLAAALRAQQARPQLTQPQPPEVSSVVSEGAEVEAEPIAISKAGRGSMPFPTGIASQVSQRFNVEKAPKNHRHSAVVASRGKPSSEDGAADKTPARSHPSQLPKCAVCGLSDWTVALTDKNGRQLHVFCSKQDRELARPRPNGRAKP